MRSRSRGAAVVLLVLSLVVAACGGGSTTRVIATVSPEDAAAELAENPAPVLLDIRTPEEVAAGHLAGSVNIDFYEADFADRIAALDRDASYVVYCRSGNRSGQAMELFDSLGFSDVIEIDGGIVAWSAAGLPVTLE
jgi:phage shock protein E